MLGYLDLIQKSEVEYKEYSKGSDTPPCVTPYSNKTG